MSTSQVIDILGKPDSWIKSSIQDFGDFQIPQPEKLCYFQNELQVSFDQEGKMEFMELELRDLQKIEVRIIDHLLNQVPARELITFLEQSFDSEFLPEDTQLHSGFFKSIDLGLWRPVVPELDESVQTIPDSDEGKYFWTIGIGSKGYYEE